MRYSNYLSEQKKFNNWIRFDNNSVKSDFEEYKKKEDYKWNSRAEKIGARFPIFKDFKEFKQSLKNAKIVVLQKDKAKNINNVALNNTIEDVKNMVSFYKRPRDVDRIVNGFKSNDKMPMPIILQGKRGKHIMTGNTRLNVSYIMNILPKILVVDVSE
jgi:hypothetical protein